MIYTKKIIKGYYKVIDTTFGDQGWRIEKDESLEGDLIWAINNTDSEKLNDLLEEGVDQLWATKSEALMALQLFI